MEAIRQRGVENPAVDSRLHQMPVVLREEMFVHAVGINAPTIGRECETSESLPIESALHLLSGGSGECKKQFIANMRDADIIFWIHLSPNIGTND